MNRSVARHREGRPPARASIESTALEKQLSGVGGEPKKLTADERALGLPDPARLPETFYATVEGVIVPGLERYGIEAGAAWRERKLEGTA